MLDYHVIGLFYAINLALYFAISLPLDFLTYQRGDGKTKENSPSFDINPIRVITFLTSLYMWLLFLFVPIDALFGFDVLRTTIFLDFEPWGTLIQILGAFLVLLATLVATWGRVSRGRRAFSWGIPKKLETDGMYHFIRHPLYASYCYYFLGFFLILQNILIIPLLLGIPGYYELSKYEEKILVDYFGDEYIEYQKKVGGFFPRFWRKDHYKFEENSEKL